MEPASVAPRLQQRIGAAQARCLERVRAALGGARGALGPDPWSAWQASARYAVDLAQRAILSWDTLRRRGNDFVAHERAGLPPVLHFDHETVADGRAFERPVNYALLRILPPRGVEVDPRRRPFVVIDPRAGRPR